VRIFLVQEIENGFVSANYVRTLNIDEPMARIKSDGTMRYYHQDALGSGIALTDETGALKTTYSYDPFGNTIISGETSDNPFQYTVIENDETGLYYYRARYYSPELQRFISEDPIGLAGGINQFTYVGNNPVNFVDPLGLTWESNWNFFWDWVFERGPAQRYYGPNTTETQEMMRSPGATNMRNTFKKGRCKNIRIEAYGKDYFGIESYIENLADPGSTGFQVGGFIYSATNNGNGTVTYRIYNQASIFSFFLHIPGLPHKPRGGSLPFMGNINQKFERSEATPCGCK
jgi:RHS repeat-associated protein